MDTIKFENAIQLLRNFSEKIHNAFNDNNELVTQLNTISQSGRATLFSTYQNATGPVKEIRKQVAEILSTRNIQLTELQTIIDKSVAENPKSFRSMYKNWYNMLYMFLIQDFRNEMNEAVELISTSIINELDEQKRIVAKKFDFTGERETGSTRCWIAIINKTHPSQTTAKQFFIDINNGEIEFCLYDRPNENRIDKTVLSKTEKLNSETLLAVFKKHLPEILNDNFEEKINFWRLGTSDGTNSYWEEMHTNNKICIGWSEIGDLNEAKVKNRKDVIALLTEEGFYKDDNRTKSRKAGEILSFYKDVKIGDIVLAQDGANILGIGKVDGDYSFNESENFSHERKIEWLIVNPNSTNSEGLRTTCVALTDENLISKIEKLIQPDNPTGTNKVKKKMNTHLNQILFGPPGTGKTFSTISKSISIANPEFNLDQDREIVKAEFDRLMQEGQIVFTTFHQSMSYEDFIEGIKPIEPKEGDTYLKYEIQNGILKDICERIKNFEKLTGNNLPVGKAITNFGQLYSAFIEKLKKIIEELDENEIHFFESRRSKVKLIKIEDNAILTNGETANSTETVMKDKLERIYNRFTSPDEITNIVKQLREVGTDIGWTTNYFAVFKALKEFEASIKSNISTDVPIIKKQNYILIIDEINRGNISQIFGELITLIEEDKRLGKNESLEVTLPYSKKKFGLPSNLYIIGTMNTADRSVEALDAALRRRFSFEEMPPIPQLITNKGKLKDTQGKVEGIDLAELLSIINKRIEKLLDKDHLIGHSYFMSVTDLPSLQEAFHNKINPLLQEYFFGDFGKIGLVLGEGFFENNGTQTGENLFASFDDYESNDLAERPVYKILNVSEMTSQDFITAIKKLINK